MNNTPTEEITTNINAKTQTCCKFREGKQSDTITTDEGLRR